MKKNVIALMCLLSLGLVACGNKAVENEEIPTENTEVVAEATEIEEVEETESTETAEEVVSGGAEAVSEEADAVADTTEKKTENKKTDASASTNAGNSNVAVTPSAPVAPAPAPTPTPAPDASANAGGSGDTIADTNNSQFTMEEIEQLEPGSQIGDTGFTWGGTFGGGEFQPTTDGYGDGTTITIEPVN